APIAATDCTFTASAAPPPPPALFPSTTLFRSFAGTGSVSVTAASYTDAALNLGGSGTDTVTIDTANPTVTVNIVDSALSDGDNSSVITHAFTQATLDFTTPDITATNGTVTGLA